MLIYSMSVSVDGFIADREGAFEWSAPTWEVTASTPDHASTLVRHAAAAQRLGVSPTTITP